MFGLKQTTPAVGIAAPRTLGRVAPKAVRLAGVAPSHVKAHRAALKPLAVAAGTPASPSSAGPKTAQAMNVVFVSTEVAPWSKTGGLGDVVGSLPVELAKRGHNVFTIAPRFDQYADAWDCGEERKITIDGESVGFFHTVKAGVHRVWIDHPWFLAKVWGPTTSKLYGSVSGADYVDNPRRFSLFCKAAIESLTALPFMPGEDAVLVANDWHSALIPVLLKDFYQPAGKFVNTPAALCVHNIAFQGRFWPETWESLALPDASRERFEFTDGYPKVFDETSPAAENPADDLAGPGQRFPKLNWLRAGITACDKLLTVSPHYAAEIASGPALGVELDGVIRAKGVEGIVNGMDVADWNPALDKFLAFKYNAETVEAGKAYAKAALQREVGLPVDPSAAVFGFIGRLEEQKGVDILIAALDKLPAGAQAQVVILGTGKKALEAEIKNLAMRFPGVAAGVAEFNNQLAHTITAGADFMMVPSRFEPCGLIQLHAMAYGTVPLVASTGGLVDTVKEGVTGFQMGAMDPDGLVEADAEAVATTIARAAEVFGTPAYAAMRDACIAQDLSWALPAKKWEATLAEMKFGGGAATVELKAEVPTPVEKLDNPTAYPDSPGPKPSDVAAAAAAPKLGAKAPPTTPAAVIAAATAKATGPKPAPSAFVARDTAKAAAMSTVSDAPQPLPVGYKPPAAAAPAATKKPAAGALASGAAKPAAAAPATAAPKAAAATPKAAAPVAAKPAAAAPKAAAAVTPKPAAPAAAKPVVAKAAVNTKA